MPLPGGLGFGPEQSDDYGSETGFREPGDLDVVSFLKIY
jgi:hypothetical protein